MLNSRFWDAFTRSHLKDPIDRISLLNFCLHDPILHIWYLSKVTCFKGKGIGTGQSNARWLAIQCQHIFTRSQGTVGFYSCCRMNIKHKDIFIRFFRLTFPTVGKPLNWVINISPIIRQKSIRLMFSFLFRIYRIYTKRDLSGKCRFRPRSKHSVWIKSNR